MVVEASSVLRSLAQDAEESVETADDAFRFLAQHGLDCVAQAVSNFIERGAAKLYVVTGLRTVEEILLLMERFPHARIVLVDSDVQTRFERHVRRGRDQEVRTLHNFEQQDEQQAHFGALRVPAEVSTDIIRNDGTVEQFKQRIDAFVAGLDAQKSRGDSYTPRAKSELHRTLYGAPGARRLRLLRGYIREDGGVGDVCEEVQHEPCSKIDPRVRRTNQEVGSSVGLPDHC